MEERTSRHHISNGLAVFVEVLNPRTSGELQAVIVEVSCTTLRLRSETQIPRDACVLVN
jgi:hypothetical protein